MTAIIKASAKRYFAAGEQPTSAQFSDLIDSYQDFHTVLGAISTAAQNGSVGFVEVMGSASVTFRAAGAVGRAIVSAANGTAAATAMGAGSFGYQMLRTATTAAGQQQLGGGTAGRGIYEAITTASVQTLVYAVATTAEAVAGTNNTALLTPHTGGYTPGAAKAWVHFDGTNASVKSSYNVATVTRTGVGTYNITFTRPFSTASYVAVGAATNPGSNIGQLVRGTNTSAAGLQVLTASANGVGTNDYPDVDAVFFGTQ